MSHKARRVGTHDQRLRAELGEPLQQVDGAHVLTDRAAHVRSDRQLVRAVAEGHERAPERLPVDRAADLDQAARAAEYGGG